MQPIFARITKVDEERREVTGRAAQEVIDRDNELFDYATSKPEFMKWSAECSTDSGGKSLGNVRSMHGNTAAGKLTDIVFDDVEKAIDITAKIVDDNEWEKVIEGVHTGFSIGGRYARKWAEAINGKMIQRYTAVPSEISIVDRPCIPTAKFFSIHKADGSVLRKFFKANTQISLASDGKLIFKGGRSDVQISLASDGKFLYKGGPGSGPHGGKMKEASEHARSALKASERVSSDKAQRASRKASAATEKANASAGTSAERAAAHDGAADAHESAAATHDANTLGTKASIAHTAAATAHIAIANSLFRASRSGK
jgi:hypothetical protein